MAQHHHLGIEGESFAASYLEQKGFQILERNWRSGRAEIDLIGLVKNILVFIEVKSRSNSFTLPESSVNKKKQKLMIKAAGDYLYLKQSEQEIRFDIISLIKKGANNWEIMHFEDAFFPNPADEISYEDSN